MATRPKKILIAEDDVNFRETLELEYGEKGLYVCAVSSLKEFRTFKNTAFNMAILDLKLGQDSGLAILEQLIEVNPLCKSVVLTGYGSFATAVKAIKLGAVNYLPKPVSLSDIDEALSGKQPSCGYFSEAADKQAPSLARHEREYIEFVLSRCDGNITKTAKQLGIHRQSLQRKLRKFTPRF